MNDKKIWVRTETEEIVENKLDELMLISLCRIFKDKANKQELEPVVCLTTEDEGGTERDFYFDFEQLSKLIDQLTAIRIDLMKETAKVFDKQLKIKHNDSRRKRKN